MSRASIALIAAFALSLWTADFALATTNGVANGVSVSPPAAQAAGGNINTSAAAEEEAATKCAKPSPEEATDLTRKVNAEIEVLEINQSSVRGLWELVVKARGKKSLAYMDCARRHILTSSIISIETRANLTTTRAYELNKVDIAEIPLELALVMGSPSARLKVVVFTDPDCTYCRRLHQEMRKVSEDNEEIAFYVMVYPMVKLHPASYKKAKSILCAKSLRLLERAYDSLEMPEPACRSAEVDDIIDLAERIGVSAMPAIILPDGGQESGPMEASQLLERIYRSVGEPVPPPKVMDPALGDTAAPSGLLMPVRPAAPATTPR